MQHSVHDLEISDDDYCGSDFYSAAEEMDADEKDGDQWHRLVSSTHPDSSRPTPKPDTPRRFNSMTLSEQSPGISTSLVRSVCVICKDALPYSSGSNVYPTCGKECASILQAATGLPNPNHTHTSGPPHSSTSLVRSVCVICEDALPYSSGSNVYPTCGKECASILQAATGPPNLNHAHTSGPPHSSTLVPSSPPSISPPTNYWSSLWQNESATYANRTRSWNSRPTQLKMCDVCHVRPQCQRGGTIYPTCGLSCAAKLHAPGSIEMCDYCKKRPKVVINGKIFPQCGRTCRDKAKLAETAAKAAACRLCILCRKSTKAAQSDFCSRACKSLADARAPFLIEIPRGHVAFRDVADFFASRWQKSNMQCPAVKKVSMIVMKQSFRTSYEKYRVKIGTTGVLQREVSERERWLVISRECGFGDPGHVEPCSSNTCLLCCIIRSSFSRLDFPAGITTSHLNRAVELGERSSSKIAVLLHVVVGREAEMTPQESQVVRPIPPLNSDSVHLIRIRNDGSKVDTGDIVVYDRDAVMPLYLISYE
ncbi:hypothetical protein BYT27DRAFT_7148208 [Phlegmacium glaucopus]|nr:hypothetical protein BYT27DRAFT_7148208 [Phlegmacium glaucopus]